LTTFFEVKKVNMWVNGVTKSGSSRNKELRESWKGTKMTSRWEREARRWKGRNEALFILTERRLVQWPHLTVTTIDKLLHGTLTCTSQHWIGNRNMIKKN